MPCWACGASPGLDFLEVPRRSFSNTLETSTVKVLGKVLVGLAFHLIWGGLASEELWSQHSSGWDLHSWIHHTLNSGVASLHT